MKKELENFTQIINFIHCTQHICKSNYCQDLEEINSLALN